MKILIFSMGPIFKDYVEGGSQKILSQIAVHLGKKHKVTIVCPSRSDNCAIFSLSDNVVVKPILPFKSYPEPYYIPPFKLATAFEILYQEIKSHDVTYVHDCELNFFMLYNVSKPFVCSLRDYIYPDTLIGAFNFKKDKLIVNSELTKKNVIATIGRYFPLIANLIEVIPNGIDLTFFKKTKPLKIKKYIPPLNTGKVLLYPHRPDYRKGIFDALEVVSRLKHIYGYEDINLLVPLHINLNTSDGKSSYYGDAHYSSLKSKCKELDIEKNVIFHKWLPFNMMPQYYSLGDLTLSVGCFVEAFGSNSSVESICCGTPVIMSRAGSQRNTFPEGFVSQVDWHDIDSIVNFAHNILSKGCDISRAQKYISQKYDYLKMLKKYEFIITKTRPSKNFKLKLLKKINFSKSYFKLAPWCYLTSGEIYNDYEFGYLTIDPRFYELLLAKSVFSFKDSLTFGLNEEYILSEFYKGNLALDI